MASNRKKQDEKHLKILRYLASLPGNKQCFDCNQRGPTYVNVTIGSFVCTSCSGLLRGLTPPHRVKSISMATFTIEEIESLQNKGNNYCKKIWLALYESDNVQNTKDEYLVRDFMVAKYEKKLYFVEPSVLKNGCSSFSEKPLPDSLLENFKGQHFIPNSSPVMSTVDSNRIWQGPTNTTVPCMTKISSPDTFRVTSTQLPGQSNQSEQQKLHFQLQEQTFANFENNPIFNSTTITSSSSFPILKSNTATEDKYAALKDLDCLMKMQQEPPQCQGIFGNGWPQNSHDNGFSLNPFQTDIKNNNVINPFRSSMVQHMDKNISTLDNCTQINNDVAQPDCWESNSYWINKTVPGAQSLASTWNGKGNVNMIPGNSKNPFL